MNPRVVFTMIMMKNLSMNVVREPFCPSSLFNQQIVWSICKLCVLKICHNYGLLTPQM